MMPSQTVTNRKGNELADEEYPQVYRILHAEQGTPEWDLMRAGKITGSVASNLLTPTGRPSTSSKGELGRLVAERMGWQTPEGIPTSYWMDRGTELEHQARLWFELETGLKVHQVGFVEHVNGLSGFSPDGIISIDGCDIPLELKVPKPSTHVSWVLDGELPPCHKQQVHFAMAILGAPFAYFMSYLPECEPLIIKVERDEYTEKMLAEILSFCESFEDALNKFGGK